MKGFLMIIIIRKFFSVFKQLILQTKSWTQQPKSFLRKFLSRNFVQVNKHKLILINGDFFLSFVCLITMIRCCWLVGWLVGCHHHNNYLSSKKIKEYSTKKWLIISDETFFLSLKIIKFGHWFSFFFSFSPFIFEKLNQKKNRPQNQCFMGFWFIM